MTTENNRASTPDQRPLCTPAVLCALASLLEARAYAEDLQTSPWEFPVELGALLRAGCDLNTLRWLVRSGYAEWAAPPVGQAPAPGPLAGSVFSFPEGTSFVLTGSGAAAARANPLLAADPRRPPLPKAASPLPRWDGQAGELHYRERLVKRFRNAASNQRRILEEFQRRRWPGELADPLPADPEVNRKQRLHDTIKNLNRGQLELCLRFYVADAGHSAGWRPLE